jgi:hypothetical protein
LPVQSGMPAPVCAGLAMEELAAHAASLRAASGGNLLECFAAVPDPRDPRGIRHRLASVLAMSAAAALCGNSTLEDVTAWAVPEAAVNDAAVAAYRLSAQAGNPLSERKLAQLFGSTSRRWARARIAEARRVPSSGLTVDPAITIGAPSP